MLVSERTDRCGRDQNEAAPYASVDGHIALRFYTTASGSDDDPVGIGLFCRCVFMAGASDFIASGYFDWYGCRDAADDVDKVFGHIDRYYAHNVYTGMEKGLDQPA